MIALREAAFDPWREVSDHEAQQGGGQLAMGAAAIFVGRMRDTNEGVAVRRMVLEHYPGMTERQLDTLCTTATERYGLLDVLVIHRTGEVRPGDPIVLVAVWCAHRAEAFEACRFIMEALKSTAPFWKKETLADGERWVEHNTPGTNGR